MSDDNEKGILSELLNGASGSGIARGGVMGIVSMVISAVMGIFMKKKTEKMVADAMEKAAASQAEAMKAAQAQQQNGNSEERQ